MSDEHSQRRELDRARERERAHFNVVAAALNEGLVRQSDGTVAFKAQDYYSFHGLLLACAEAFPLMAKKIPRLHRSRLVVDAAKRAGATGVITADLLEKELRDGIKSFLGQPVKQFTVLGRLSVVAEGRPMLRTIGQCRITISAKSPRNFDVTPGEEFRKTASLPEAPEHFSWLRIDVDARTPQEAQEKSAAAFDLLRGIWCWLLAPAIEIPRRNRPQGEVFWGPVHTVHHADGKCVEGAVWYEPHFPRDAGTLRTHRRRFKGAALRRDEAWVKERLRKLGSGRTSQQAYSETLKNSLRNYGRALDAPDFNTAFLRMWGILESLTATEMENYAETVRRAAFLFANSAERRAILDAVRNVRNRTVHQGEEQFEGHLVYFLLKRHVDALLQFHLHWCLRFSGLSEACAGFLGLNPEDSGLQQINDQMKRTQAIVRWATRFRSKSAPAKIVELSPEDTE
jgi:hypothetical protein